MPGAALSAARLRQLRRGRGLLQRRLAAGGHVLQDITTLLSARGDDGENVLNKMTPGLAVRPVARLSPHHCVSQRPLGRVVGRLNACDVNEGPQCLLNGQYFPASPCRLGARARTTGLQLEADPRPSFVACGDSIRTN